MNLVAFLLIFLHCLCSVSQAGELPPFAVAVQPVPVFNSPKAALPGAALKKDGCGQVRSLEMIALPGTIFKVIATVPGTENILQVTTDDYQAPAGTSLYVAAKLLKLSLTAPLPRRPQLPQQDAILQKLLTAVGLPYIWGGNLREGVNDGVQQRFAGLDCSGLLYEATDGYTPRNTEQLVQFGSAVPIEGLRIEKLAQQLRPLDLIVWKGHVVILLDQHNTIESVMNCGETKNGVVVTPLKRRLEQLLKQRQPANSWPAGTKKAALFVVRRWL